MNRADGRRGAWWRAGTPEDVAKVKESYTRQYLRAYADGKWNDNLLALPECV